MFKKIQKNNFQKRLGYRACVGAMIFNSKTKKVFVGKRFDITAAWQMPQGGVDKNEPPRKAVLREAYEETGMKSLKIIAAMPGALCYDIPKKYLLRFWNGKYRGQRQKWFLLTFYGDDSEINTNGNHNEFSEWKWLEVEQVPGLAVEFKSKIYSRVVKYFTPIIEQYYENI